VFSYRRTAWGGLAIAVVLFALCQPKQLRYKLLLGFAVLGLPALLYKAVQRSGENMHGASMLERLMPDIAANGELSFTTGRFSELYAAFLSFKESPVFGLGAWGRYDGSRFSELSWHHGDFGWMHSGLLHVALKSGLVGAGISVWVLVAVIRFVVRVKASMHVNELGIMMAGLAGLLFMLPNWLIGTPVIEYRTMQLMALTVALPYMAYATSKSR
jgi:O-Antigen ligase